MKYRLELRPEASADVAEAFSWYEQQRAGLGGELEAELKQRDARIMDLTQERDKERKLSDEWREGSDQWNAAFDAWKKRASR